MTHAAKSRHSSRLLSRLAQTRPISQRDPELAAELAQGPALLETAAQLLNAPALLLVTGMLTVVAGLAIVLGHNVWRGGATPVIVTILGWLMLLKGFALLVVPASRWVVMLEASHYMVLYPVTVAIALVLGGYLTFSGFSAGRSR